MAFNPDQIHFTSDLHFGHQKIIHFCNRPWDDTKAMTLGLIERWNEQVKQGDTVVIAGDVSFTNVNETVRILQALNGQKILAPGNHDSGLIKRKEFLDQFTKVSPIIEVLVQDPDGHGGNQRIVVCHYAMKVWNLSHRGAWHLYGHSHGNLVEDDSKSFDVGVDSHDWRPWTYSEVKDKMATKRIHEVDHHKEKKA